MLYENTIKELVETQAGGYRGMWLKLYPPANQLPGSKYKTITDAQLAAAKIETDRMKAEASHALQSDNMDLKESQFMHKKRIDEAELEVLQRNSTDVRGIASPTG